MVDAYEDPFRYNITELDNGNVTICVNDGTTHEAGPDVPVDYSAPAEVIALQFSRWRKPQGPVRPFEIED